MLAILLGVALQAPPAAPPAKPTVTVEVKPAAPKAEPPKPETLDEQIKRALATHPDLRVAQAQVELAQAKLEQERQRVAHEITTARALRDAAVAGRNSQVELMELTRRANGSAVEVKQQEQLVARYQENVAQAEGRLLAATGGPPKPPGPATAWNPADLASMSWGRPADGFNGTLQYRSYLELVNPNIVIAPPATPGDFRADFADMLDRRITPAKKTGTVGELAGELLAKAAAAAGKPAPVVVGQKAGEVDKDKYALNGESDTLGGWLQQLTDIVSREYSGGGGLLVAAPRFNFYVREYGLLPAFSNSAPAGAETVTAFWERSRATKAKKDKPTAPPAK